MKRVLSILVVILSLLILPSFVFAQTGTPGCCINDQPSFGQNAQDVTCFQSTPGNCPPGATYVATASCAEIPECGCCAANPDTSAQIYQGGDLLTTANFCRDAFPGKPTKIIPFKTASECLQIPQGRPISTTPSIGAGVGNITGTVRASGLAISGLSVVVDSSQGTFSTTTDSSGAFTFLNKPLGNYDLGVEGCGYLRYVQVITNSANEDAFSININTAPKESVVIDTIDASNKLVSGVSFTASPSINVPDSLNGKSTISNIDSNCGYKITATYQGKVITQQINISSEDAITFYPLTFTFPSLPDECQNIPDCRGPDGVLGQGIDCTHFCSQGQSCSAATGSCVVSSQLNCCEYDFQCLASNQMSNSLTCSANEVECKNTCDYVPRCPENTKLSLGTAGPICKCGAPVLVQQGLTLKGYDVGVDKFCCSGSLSDKRCEFLTHFRAYGQIADNKGPLAAEIVVDGNTVNEKVYYSDSLGNYEIFLDANTHIFNYRKEPAHQEVIRNVQGASGTQRKIDITLPSPTGNCEYPAIPQVPDFRVEHIKGKPSAVLRWNNGYCGSSGPQSFAIAGTVSKGTSIIINATVDSSQSSYEIEDLDWNKEYDFSISAVYVDHGNIRASFPVVVLGFDPGDASCEDVLDSNEFCLDLTKRRTCNSQNKILTSVDVSSYHEDCGVYKSSGTSQNDWYCAEDSQSQGKTKCIEMTQCGYQISTLNIPFLGLLYNDVLCSSDLSTGLFSKGCYVDSSSTSVDFCYQCPIPTSPESDCSLYKSDSACGKNRCGVGSGCAWKDSEFGSLGKGVCYDKKNMESKKKIQIEDLSAQTLESKSSCELCDSSSSLFSNIGCTQNVCSSLGLCYEEVTSPNFQVSSCSSCNTNPARGKITTCRDLKTENSCVNATGESQAFVGNGIYSDDACGIGSCVWNGTTCYKDSNYDSRPDCEDGFGKVSLGCEQDYTPPETTLRIGNFILNKDLSSNRNELLFSVSERIQRFDYCLYEKGKPRCDVFLNISGTSILSQEFKINPIVSFNKLIKDSGTYYLRFRSLDLFSNLEETKEMPLTIDSGLPQISIDYFSECSNCGEGSKIDCGVGETYLSKVELSLQSDKFVICKDYLIPPGLSKGGSLSSSQPGIYLPTPLTKDFVILNGEERHEFTGLADGEYRYVVECEDFAGNKNSVNEIMSIESSKIISSVSPKASLLDGKVKYDVSTTSPSLCKISLDGNQYINLESSTGLRHSKEFSYQPNSYHHYGVLCIDNNPLLEFEGRCDYSAQEFIVDTKPPSTKGVVGSKEFFNPGWESAVSDSTEMRLIPSDDGDNGLSFGIDYTQYCISPGTKCLPDSPGGIKVFYPDPVTIPVTNNLGICYYSVDKGGNKEEPKCGKIIKTTPPVVTINLPASNFVTDDPIIVVKGTHNANNVVRAFLVVSNRTHQKIVQHSTTPFLSPSSFDMKQELFAGENLVSVQIEDSGGIVGEESITVYLDKTAPEMESKTASVFEYGEDVSLSVGVKDREWTALKTGDGIGEIASVFALARSNFTNLTTLLALNRVGSSWNANIASNKQGLFYELVPGFYSLAFGASDSLGNSKIFISNFTVEKSTPVNFSINLSQFNYRKNDVFYTNQSSPAIFVRTQEPADCGIQLLVSPVVESGLSSSQDGLEHNYSSLTLSFLPKIYQEMGAVISCKDKFSQTPQLEDLKVIFDPIPPEVNFRSSEGEIEIEKEDKVYNLNSFSTTLEISSNEEIRCSLMCIKGNGKNCGRSHESLINNFNNGNNQYVESQSLNINYLSEDNPYGTFHYQLSCQDKGGNLADTEDLFVRIIENDYKIVERGPVSEASLFPEVYVKTNFPSSECKLNGNVMAVPGAQHPRFNEKGQYFYISQGVPLTDNTNYEYDVVCEREVDGKSAKSKIKFKTKNGYVPNVPLISPKLSSKKDTAPPVITNIDLLTNLGSIGVIDLSRTDQNRKLSLVNGMHNNEFKFKLVVDTNEVSECRYDHSPNSFDNMPSENSMGLPSYYQETSYLVLPDKRTKQYYVSCKDLSGNVGKQYILEVFSNSESPIVIQSPYPKGEVSSGSLVVTALTQRNLNCEYDDGTNPRRTMFSTLTPQGYRHNSAQFQTQKLSLSQGEHSFIISCGGQGLPKVSESINFTVDSLPPVLSLNSPPLKSKTADSFFEINGITEPGTELSFYVNGFLKKIHTVPKSNASSLPFTTILYLDKQGANNVELVAKDPAGNKQSLDLEVDTSYSGPKVATMYPYLATLPALEEVRAKILGTLSSSSEIIVRDINGTVVFRGNRYDPSIKELSVPTPKLGPGIYESEVVLKDKNGKSGFGSYGYFEIKPGPSHSWQDPSIVRNSLSRNSLLIGADSLNADRLITEAGLSFGKDLGGLTQFKVEREGKSYLSSSILPQGKNYLKILFSDLSGFSKSIRILDIDNEGPKGTITPSGIIKHTRPDIKAKLQEVADLKSFSLTNKNGEQQTIVLKSSNGDEFEFSPGTQLLPGSYVFSMEVEDVNGNKNVLKQAFTTQVSNILINLKYPLNGVAPNSNFNLEFETNQDAECRFSNLPVGNNFNSHAGIFTSTGKNIHSVNFNSRATYPDEQEVYVTCKSAFAPVTPSTKFLISSDTVAPNILNLEAIPNQVTESPLQTKIVVSTDKQALCRLDCLGNTNYDSMGINFGTSYSERHAHIFIVEDKKDYSCNVMCESRSGLKTSVKSVNFVADTALRPTYQIISPKDGASYSNRSILVDIKSPRLARCAFSVDNGTFVRFNNQGYEFTGNISNLTSGEHILDVDCLYSQGSEKKRSTFKIDFTPPVNVSVNAPVEACSVRALNISLYSNDPESGIEGYVYSVRDSTDKFIINNTFTTSPTIGKISSLKDGKSYSLVVKARNKAGLESKSAESSTFRINSNSSRCVDSVPPVVTLFTNKTEGKTLVTLKCSDSETGCSNNKNYGISLTQSSCNPTSKYISPVEMTQEGYFCYEAFDNAGNVARDTKKISVIDSTKKETLKVNLDFDRKGNSTIVTLSCDNGNCTSMKYGVGKDFVGCTPDQNYLSPVEVNEEGTYFCYLVKDDLGRTAQSARKVPLVQTPKGPEKRPPFKYLYLLLGIILLGVGGYFSYSYLKSQHPSLKTGTPRKSPTIPEGRPLHKVKEEHKFTLPKHDEPKPRKDGGLGVGRERDKEKERLRNELFDRFVNEKRKTVPTKSKIKDKEVFDDLNEMVGKSKDFKKLISKADPLTKDEFSELSKLAKEKGVLVSENEFQGLMDLVNKKKEKKNE
jgi:hypothetical protein